MAKELAVIQTNVLSVEEKTELQSTIDHIIEQHKGNRQDINRLVFESVEALTEAENAQAELANKNFFRRWIGDLTGSNQRLQDKINKNHAIAQYAAQQMLQRIAEQNLMTFDLIAAINNKLNASLHDVNAEFQKIYQGLSKFLRSNRNELVRMETRLDKIEQNVKLLNWQSSIEYQDFDGEEYVDLDDNAKITCLVSDFYDITKGDWSTSDLLLLKRAMSDIDLEPKQPVNYYGTLKAIALNPTLREKLLGDAALQPIETPSYLISMSVIGKLEALETGERYLVDSVLELTGQSGAEAEDNARDVMVNNYLKRAAGVQMDVMVESYDLVLDLLYNLREAKMEKLLSLPEETDVQQEQEEQEQMQAREQMDQVIEAIRHSENLEEAFIVCKKLAEDGYAEAFGCLGRMYYEGYGTEKDFEAAFTWSRRGAENGDVDAMYRLGNCYWDGEGIACNHLEALRWYREAARAGNGDAMDDVGDCYYYGEVVAKDYEQAAEWWRKAAEAGYGPAMNHLARCYYNGKGVSEDYEEAFRWYQRGAEVGIGDGQTLNALANCYYWGNGVAQDKEKAYELFVMAAKLGDEKAKRTLHSYEVARAVHGLANAFRK